MWAFLLLLPSITFHHHFSQLNNIKMALDLTQASETPSDPSRTSAADNESLVPSTKAAPNTVYAYLQGPNHKDDLRSAKKYVAPLNFHALEGTIESLAGEKEKHTAELLSAMKTLAQERDRKNVRRWAWDYLGTDHGSERPCDDEGYKVWCEDPTLDMFEGMAGEHNARQGKDGIRISVIRDPEVFAEVKKGKTQQLSHYFENPYAQSTHASTNG
jgi:hypothetical protein